MDLIVNCSLEEDTQKIMSSYRDPNEMVPVAIYKDGNIQRAFKSWKHGFPILNPLQK
jgi:hypothetical protein